MAIKGSRGGQFNVSPSRFAGYEGLADWVGMDDPEAANDAVANAKHYSSYQEVDVPIGGLQAMHPIDRNRARGLMNSIKSRGFDPTERIEVFGDTEGGIVLDGHHRAIAARAAGMKKIPAVVYDPGEVGRYIDVLKEYK